MATLMKNQKSAVVTGELSREDIERLSRIISEETGKEEYLIGSIELHNEGIKQPEPPPVRRILWLMTHKLVYLTFALAMIIPALIFALIVGIATEFFGAFYLFGAVIGLFLGFVVGSFIFPLHVNMKNCDKCESLLSRRELYRYKITSEQNVERVNVYNNSTQRFSNQARLIETTLYAVITECKTCGRRALEVVREKKDITL